jgi:sulfide:quinone oxidoreductase
VGLRRRPEIALVVDFAVPIPRSPDASEARVTTFAERGIEWHPRREASARSRARNLRQGGMTANG